MLQYELKYATEHKRGALKEQCQVAQWSIQNRKPEYRIHIYVGPDPRNPLVQIPLYWFILDARPADGYAEMKGIWKSVYATLVYSALKITIPSGHALELMRFAFSQDVWPEKMLVLVTARIGLTRMFDRHQIPLQMVGKIPRKVQGASAPAQFYLSDLFL